MNSPGVEPPVTDAITEHHPREGDSQICDDTTEAGFSDDGPSDDEFFDCLQPGDAPAIMEPVPPSATQPPGLPAPANMDPGGVAGSDSQPISVKTLPHARGMYRLLNLVTERGIGGILDKVVIDEAGFAQFANTIHPGSYQHQTKVDFQQLDTLSIRPIGIYGSLGKLVELLTTIGCIDNTMSQAILDHSVTGGPSTFRTGLYIVDARNVETDHFYVIYWPEKTTWERNASPSVSRNRATFLRYLTKLCNQVICLISDEDQAQLHWDATDVAGLIGEETQAKKPASKRAYRFQVQHINHQHESAKVQDGFTVDYGPISPAQTIHSIVAGDLAQGVLIVEHTPETMVDEPISFLSQKDVANLCSGGSQAMLSLDPNIGFQDLHHLLENGLAAHFPNILKSFDIRMQRLPEEQKLDRSTFAAENSAMVEETLRKAEILLRRLFLEELLQTYPVLNRESFRLILSHYDRDQPLDLSWLETCMTSAELIRPTIELQLSGDPSYDQLKRNLPQSRGESSSPSRLRSFWRYVPSFSYSATKRAEDILREDVLFLNSLHLDASKPQEQPTVNEIKIIAVKILDRRAKQTINAFISALKSRLKMRANAELEHRLARNAESKRDNAWNTLRRELVEELNKFNSSPEISTLLHLTGIWPANQSALFAVNAVKRTRRLPGLLYTIRLLEIHQDDALALERDIDHPFRPIVSEGGVASPSFVLPNGASLRLLRPIGKSKCLAIVEDSDQNLNIFIEGIFNLNFAIRSQACKASFPGVASSRKFVLDEVGQQGSYKLIELHSGQDHIEIRIHTFDEQTDTLITTRAVDITKWYQDDQNAVLPLIEHIVLQSGSKEMLLLQNDGFGRFWSFEREQFRPKGHYFGGSVQAVFSSPDKSAFFILNSVQTTCRLRCFHWASLGSNDGHVLEHSATAGLLYFPNISAVSRRDNVHLLYLDPDNNTCASVAVRITSKHDEFTLRSNQPSDSQRATIQTQGLSNPLIDVHGDIWDKFPVEAAIQRSVSPKSICSTRTLTFVSSQQADLFKNRIAHLIRAFKRVSGKPTGDYFTDGNYIVNIVPSFDPFNHGVSVSMFPIGDWLLGLICLVPLQLAIANSGYFVPLCNGVVSEQFERSLFNQSVPHIADSLSIGWYESVLSSYLAKLPVKVVTSMGEQSVGKSYALNHFVDSSFAGSAMRCTEGVWLSITPTSDMLIVALDFEGIGSIERTGHEDTFLVLFNAAISNLVLFRNNFAVTRNISDSFKSFQSSTQFRNLSKDKDLFQSTLAIIIKDVLDKDRDGIVQEFELKFAKMVRDERSNNFISCLHQGEVTILPWPVIGSEPFYEEFAELKDRLDAQPVTYPSAGQFLQVLKMLMAKIKKFDWTSISDTLSAQRAAVLRPLVPLALAFGRLSSFSSSSSSLTNLDTAEIIEGPNISATFFVAEVADPDSNIPLDEMTCLEQLRQSWEGMATRFSVHEEEFVDCFNNHLAGLARARFEQVRRWLDANTLRFKDHPDIKDLNNCFDRLCHGILTSITLCGSRCHACDLLCLNRRNHGGIHECTTDHKCPQPCTFLEQHAGNPGDPICQLRAGHAGHHLCGLMEHRCNLQCALFDRNGCLKKCAKDVGHNDHDGHLCSARTHTCGEPCSLQVQDGYICPDSCAVDCRDEHDQHQCGLGQLCPIRCQFNDCENYCSSRDHFHALKEGAIHLCGNTHPCPNKCDGPGICKVDPVPKRVDSTFDGRYERFDFTKQTQEARYLKCVISIPAHQLSHSGNHVHDETSDFHYCETRCPHCEYFCSWPINHSQEVHMTSHGSMVNTSWVVEGDSTAAFELNGRLFASGDSGAPMICSMVCNQMGRGHLHIDTCRIDTSGNCAGGDGVRHIQGTNDIRERLDWIAHDKFWERSGFIDPYDREDRENFGLCHHFCPDPQHDPNHETSLCVLPLFHRPATTDDRASITQGYISRDGHLFPCDKPDNSIFHIILVIDSSWSMGGQDHLPIERTPVATRISTQHNNRYGAVISSLYAFWVARQASNPDRRDVTSIILFDTQAETILCTNNTKNAEELVDCLVGKHSQGGTFYDRAIEEVKAVMESQWSPDRVPIVIFLSDGECDFTETNLMGLCNSATQRGHPLSFNTIGFGDEGSWASLQRMAEIGEAIQNATPHHSIGSSKIRGPISKFSRVLDTNALVTAYLDLADSLHKTRGGLKRDYGI